MDISLSDLEHIQSLFGLGLNAWQIHKLESYAKRLRVYFEAYFIRELSEKEWTKVNKLKNYVHSILTDYKHEISQSGYYVILIYRDDKDEIGVRI